jgi:hypothetical protein
VGPCLSFIYGGGYVLGTVTAGIGFVGSGVNLRAGDSAIANAKKASITNTTSRII